MVMKKVMIAVVFLLSAVAGFAQSEKYMKAMEKNIAALDSAYRPDALQSLSNTFERIGDAEKTEWLPYYYAAYCNVMIAFQNKDKADEIADKANLMLIKAEAIAKENAEIYCVKNMIATAHMMVDPQARWMQYGAMASEALAKAEALDASNPRIDFLKAQAMMYTPEQFGGGKKVAKPIFESCVAKYKAFKPASTLHPNWGMVMAERLLADCSK
jgi:hypothetical protein